MKTDIGEYVVGAYLKLEEGGDVVDYNVRPPGGGLEGLSELDVVGYDFRNGRAFQCEAERAPDARRACCERASSARLDRLVMMVKVSWFDLFHFRQQSFNLLQPFGGCGERRHQGVMVFRAVTERETAKQKFKNRRFGFQQHPGVRPQRISPDLRQIFQFGNLLCLIEVVAIIFIFCHLAILQFVYG